MIVAASSRHTALPSVRAILAARDYALAPLTHARRCMGAKVAMLLVESSITGAMS